MNLTDREGQHKMPTSLKYSAISEFIFLIHLFATVCRNRPGKTEGFSEIGREMWNGKGGDDNGNGERFIHVLIIVSFDV